MKTLYIVVTYLIGIGELLLAVYFWRSHSKNPIRQTMAFLTFVTGAWVLTTALTVYQDLNIVTEISSRLVYVFGIFSLTALLQFAILFPLSIFNLKRGRVLLLYLPAIILAVLVVFTNLIIQGEVLSADYYGHSIAGQLYWAYNGFLFLLYLITLIILYIKIRKVDVQKNDVKIIFYALLISGIPTVIIDLGLTTLTTYKPTPLIGVLLNSVWMGAILYILFRKR